MLKLMLKFVVLLVTATVSAEAMAAGPTIDSVSVTGDGCPSGSYQAIVSESREVLVVSFEAMDTRPGVTTACHVSVKLAGVGVAAFATKVVARGFAAVPAAATFHQLGSVGVQGVPLKDAHDRTIGGPYNDAFENESVSQLVGVGLLSPTFLTIDESVSATGGDGSLSDIELELLPCEVCAL